MIGRHTEILLTRRWSGDAIRVHHGAAARSGVYLLGGVHAREWGSPDILVNFVQLLTDAYRTVTGITQGGAAVSVELVRAIVDTLDAWSSRRRLITCLL